MAGKRIDATDLVGAGFGRLKVQNYDGYYDLTGSGRKKHWYVCQCECGNNYLARRDHLLEGRVKSCGNCQKIRDEGTCMRYVTSKGDSFLFDREDYDLACSYSWCVSNNSVKGKHHRYVVTRMRGSKIILFSRMVMHVDENQTVDHINGDTLDNRRCNLRVAEIVENSRNTRLRSDNTTGYKGVGYIPGSGRYRAYLGLNGKFIALGNYDTPEKAAKAYDEAARYYFREFACLNFPLPGEQGCRRGI